MFSPCSAKIRASEKDLPVRQCNKTKVDVLGLKVDTVKIAHCFSVKSMGQERHLEMPIFHHKILPINQTETERKLLAMNCHHTVSDLTPTLPTFSSKYDVVPCNFDNCKDRCI